MHSEHGHTLLLLGQNSVGIASDFNIALLESPGGTLNWLILKCSLQRTEDLDGSHPSPRPTAFVHSSLLVIAIGNLQ